MSFSGSLTDQIKPPRPFLSKEVGTFVLSLEGFPQERFEPVAVTTA